MSSAFPTAWQQRAVGDVFLNATQSPYNAVGNNSTDNRLTLQAALDAVYNAGGGVVYLPAGIYRISGTGTASDGALRIRSNVALVGDGMGATIIKVVDGQSSNITGIIRTPSGQSHSNIRIADITLDGNRSGPGNSATVIGFYCGPTPGIRAASITRSSTTATLTKTSHGLSNGATVTIQNADQADYNITATISGVTTNTFNYTVANSPTTPATGKFVYYPNLTTTTIYCYDITCENVEIQYCSDYGFDPHERTKRLCFVRCKAHHNGTDGFVADYIEDGIYEDCIAYSNDRHGFNLTTCTNSFILSNPISCNNGSISNGNGVVIQRGSEDLVFPRNIIVRGGIIYGNNRSGITLQMANGVTINGNAIYENGRQALYLRGAAECIVNGNNLRSNSQTTNNTYDGVQLQEYDDTSVSSTIYPCQNNLVFGNVNYESLTNKARYGFRVDSDTSNSNIIAGNLGGGQVTNTYFGLSESIVEKRITTTDATPTTIYTFPIQSSTCSRIKVVVVARRTGGSSGTAEDSATYEINESYRNVSSTATLIGSANNVTDEVNAAWACATSISSGNVNLVVTGAANNNISWHMTVRVYQVNT